MLALFKVERRARGPIGPRALPSRGNDMAPRKQPSRWEVDGPRGNVRMRLFLRSTRVWQDLPAFYATVLRRGGFLSYHIATVPHVRNEGRPRVQSLVSGGASDPGLGESWHDVARLGARAVQLASHLITLVASVPLGRMLYPRVSVGN